MSWHLAPAACGTSTCTHCLEEHIRRGNSQRERQCAVTIGGKESVVSGFQRKGGSTLQCLMARSRNLEEGLLLPFEKNLAIVDAS